MFEIFNTIFKYKEKQSPDQLGLYPERVHVEAMPERRYLWTSRVLVILSCLSISFNMMLAATIYLLLPQRTVYPRLFQINKYFSMLEQVQPAEINYPVSDLITEEHITEYIMLRYIVTSDYDELITRWATPCIGIRPATFMTTLPKTTCRTTLCSFAKNPCSATLKSSG